MAELQEYERRRVSPFLKWAGGKGQLLEIFSKLYPASFNTYFEPFLGGAAVFFNLYNKRKIHTALLSDSNVDLINCYVAVRNNLQQLLVRLESLQRHTKDEGFFYGEARPTFNSIKLKTGEEGDVEKAALLIYLNKTCYNGLYRVNKKGEFNVPWGKYKNPQLITKLNIAEVSRILKERGVELHAGDYKEIERRVRKGDFIYLDPPYHPVSTTASFTSYTSQDFSIREQKELADFFDELNSKGALMMLSNSPKVLPYYVSKGYTINRLKAARAISSVGSKRGPVDEVLVTNY